MNAGYQEGVTYYWMDTALIWLSVADLCITFELFNKVPVPIHHPCSIFLCGHRYSHVNYAHIKECCRITVIPTHLFLFDSSFGTYH